MLILVDADIVTFQAAAGSEGTVNFGPDGEGHFVDPDLALFKCNERMLDIMEKLESDDVLLCFSGRKNFRYDALPTYKHNRKGKQKPKLLGMLKDHLSELYPSRCEDRLEADDLLGILTVPEETAIATIDKDLDQIAGVHYNWKHDTIYKVQPKEALQYTWLQVLTGDSTDGYKGIPRTGPKKAQKLLDLHRDDSLSLEEQASRYDDACWEAYANASLTWDYYASQVAVAQILQGDAMWYPDDAKVHTRHLIL